jgi:hypothetical protein
MFAVFNIILIGLVLLIAYWWANQGAFSAFIHLVCVLVAGAIAFGVWEPIAVLMINRNFMADYAWGVALLGPFALALLLCRVAADKLVSENLNFPQSVNLVAGGLMGAASGTLTMGMLLIGGGFFQSSLDLMGFSGSFRTVENRGQPELAAERLWLPAHLVTEGVYDQLSAGAFQPEFGRPLRNVYPGLAHTAMSLHRDGPNGGRAKSSAAADAVKVLSFWYSPDLNAGTGKGAFVVELEVLRGAGDKGTVTVSASQLRLLENVPASSSRAPAYAFPASWSQPTDSGARQVYAFDDATNFASNVPGQDSTKFMFVFPATPLGGATQPPQYLMFKGLRLRLPALDTTQFDQVVAMQRLRGADPTAAGATPLVDPAAKTIARKDLVIDASIAPAVTNVNELTTMEYTSVGKQNLLTSGVQEFPRGGKVASPTNRISAIYAPDGTAVVRLNISRSSGTSIDLWNSRSKLREEAGDTAALRLVDSNGNEYMPIGYIWVKPDGVEIRVDPKDGIATIGDFPNQPSSGSNELYALFAPTAGVRIVSIRLGTLVVANADLEVKPPS